MEIYFDNNATTQALPEVIEAVKGVPGSEFGNPSSAHSTGNRARYYLNWSREQVGNLIGSDPVQVIFTGSGTEANSLVLYSCLQSNPAKKLLTTPVEHSSILKLAQGLSANGDEVIWLDVDEMGHLDLDVLQSKITSETALVSIQWVNNETGVIQPIREISEICKQKGVLLHVDAAQAVGKIKINIQNYSIDFLTFTGHKIHGPQGVGGLYAKDLNLIKPLILGGPQEFGLRAGTENLPGIVGMGKAAELRKESFTKATKVMLDVRDFFESELFKKIPNVKINGDVNHRICNTSNVLFNGIDGQALVARLDHDGIRCSQSSACTNQRPEPSYVLRAMGLSEAQAFSSVRFSFSELNETEEVSMAIASISNHVRKLQEFQGMLIPDFN